MMFLVLRFKACTVCKTVGAWTSALLRTQTERCQLKVKHIGCVILSLSPISSSTSLSLSLSTTMTYFSNNMSAVKMTELSKYLGEVSRVGATTAYIHVTV